MRDDLLAKLQIIIDNADHMLTRTTLNELQRKFLHSIFNVSTDLRDLVIVIPDLTWEKTLEVLSYEGRSHLSSIIGYAEVLLDEEEGELSLKQRNLIHDIRSNGKHILSRLTELSDS